MIRRLARALVPLLALLAAGRAAAEEVSRFPASEMAGS